MIVALGAVLVSMSTICHHTKSQSSCFNITLHYRLWFRSVTLPSSYPKTIMAAWLWPNISIITVPQQRSMIQTQCKCNFLVWTPRSCHEHIEGRQLHAPQWVLSLLLVSFGRHTVTTTDDQDLLKFIMWQVFLCSDITRLNTPLQFWPLQFYARCCIV